MKNVIVIGGGRWGKNLIRTFYELGALRGIAEAHEGLREELQAQYPNVEFYASHDEVLKTDVEAVAIATPVSTHFKLAKAALEAGKDVFVEKPMTETEAEGRELVELAKVNGRILMVGHLLLYQPAIQFIRSFIEEGKLGEVYAYHQVRRNLGTIRTHENVLYSLGVHDVAVLDYLIGETPVSIKAQGQDITSEGIADELTAHCVYPSGVQAHLTLSWLWPVKDRHLMVLGEKGALYFDELAAKVTFLKNHGNPDATITQGGEEVVFEGSAQPLTLELQHFLDCVDSRELPKSHGEQGANVVGLMEKMNKEAADV